MERKDFIAIPGSKSRVSVVMNRKRKLTMEMTRNLHKAMQLPAETLIQDYPLQA